jgi:AraC-type DNA-binding domain-containing proteins
MEVLPASENSIYDERETGKTHTPFQYEYVLYQAIRRGDVEQIETCIDRYMKSGFVVGRLSSNAVRQFRYWAVASISTAIHYAILGGLDETDAYNLSDVYVRHIDGVAAADECVAYLKEKAVELTRAVRLAKETRTRSYYINKAIHYIHIHLHEKLSLPDIAAAAGLSPEYLASLFKKETGKSLHTYILGEKLEASKAMLVQGRTSTEISSTLFFSSQSPLYIVFPQKNTVVHPNSTGHTSCPS